jgi:hypothetical protein
MNNAWFGSWSDKSWPEGLTLSLEPNMFGTAFALPPGVPPNEKVGLGRGELGAKGRPGLREYASEWSALLGSLKRPLEGPFDMPF